MLLPKPRGPLSAWVVDRLRGASGPDAPHVTPVTDGAHDLLDDDLQLALWACYELHYRGFDGVDDEVEWAPDLLAFRARLEAVFVAALQARVGSRPVAPADVPAALAEITADGTGPSLSKTLRRHATRHQFSEFVVHRSVYHLKEADPHTFAIPRLAGRAKAAMVEIQTDEYGGGRRRADARDAVREGHDRPRPRRGLRRLRRPRAGHHAWPPATSCRCSGCTGAGGARRRVTSPPSR